MSDSVLLADILNYLPHRYPFLLIDRILSIEPGRRITALKNVTLNEPYFQGHFPGMPIMPGVLIVEAMAQAGGILVMNGMPPEQYGQPVYFMGMDGVRFRKPVIPGDQLLLEVELLRTRKKVVKLAGLAKVDGNRVAEAELMATFGETS